MGECFSTAHERRCGQRSRSICDEAGSRAGLSGGRRVGDGVPRGRVGTDGSRTIRGAPRVLRRLQELPGAGSDDDRVERPTRRTAARGARSGAARGVPRVARPLNAYKFLAEGAVAPFTGFRWEPGAWI